MDNESHDDFELDAVPIDPAEAAAPTEVEMPVEMPVEPEPELETFGGANVSAPRRPTRVPWIPIVLVALVVLAIAAYVWWPRGEGESPAADHTVQVVDSVADQESSDQPPAEPIEVPSLDASDEIVRRLVAGLSARPELARWLATDELARRFAAAVDNVAEGVAPKTHVPFLAPEGSFGVTEIEGRLTVDPASHRRYDTLTAVVTSLDTEGSVRLYRGLRPLFDEAYRDLGYPAGSFDDTLERAIRHLLAAPVEQADGDLSSGVLSYKYADSRIENLSGVQKQLLRFGPRNARRIQTKLRELAMALGLNV